MASSVNIFDIKCQFLIRGIDSQKKQIFHHFRDITCQCLENLDLRVARSIEDRIYLCISSEEVDLVFPKVISKQKVVAVNKDAFLRAANEAESIFRIVNATSVTSDEFNYLNPDQLRIFATRKIYSLLESELYRRLVRKVINMDKRFMRLSCYEYAFLRTKEKRAFVGRFSIINLKEQLAEWGYTISQKPKEGCLVLYSKEGTPKHLGIYRDGFIESKWGFLAKDAYIHTLEEAPESYGVQVFYCIKP